MGERIGIVGIGLMGSALSANLMQAGYEVQGYDVDGRRVDEFAERGGIPMESAAAAAKGARWMVTSLPTSDIVREAVFGEGPVTSHLKPRELYVGVRVVRPKPYCFLWCLRR